MQVFYGGEEASQVKVKGPSHAARAPHKLLLQECLCFSRYVQFYHGLNLLQETAVFLQEGTVFLQESAVVLQEGADSLQESADSLQEGRTFYRKLYVYRKLPVGVLGGQNLS